MDIKLYSEKDYKVSSWTGGKTTELAMFPPEGSYVDRQFVWRLSSATCDQEECSFSKLPDYDRVLLVLKGDVVLAHQDVRVARLAELEQDRFDGGYNTRSFGQIIDYNLMVRKGCQGFLEVVPLSNDSVTMTLEDYGEYPKVTEGYFCRDGFATVTVNGKTTMIKPGDQLVINYEKTEDVTVSVMGEGTLIRAQAFYDYSKGQMTAEYIPPEQVSFSDFKECIYLANSQFRGAGFIFKRLKTEWIDEALSKSIHKIEKFYLSFVIMLAGVIAAAVLGYEYLDGLQWLWAVLIWIVVDCLLITPLIYLSVVPKPVKKHIKKIVELTPYEREVMEKEAMTNERVERILKKYKHTGRAVYDEEGNRLDKTF